MGEDINCYLKLAIFITAAPSAAEPKEATPAKPQEAVKNYVDRIPAAARELLDKELDDMNDGVDKDLGQIAKLILGWEGQLATLLCLTEMEISDIVQKDSQILERLVSYNRSYSFCLIKLCRT